MRLTQLYLYTSKRHLFVKNTTFKICKKCVNFIEDKSNDPDDTLFGRCKMFGEQNIITGEVENDNASLCRYDNTKCGIDGKYFNTIIINQKINTIYNDNNKK
jgi:hypothetical protein